MDSSTVGRHHSHPGYPVHPVNRVRPLRLVRPVLALLLASLLVSAACSAAPRQLAIPDTAPRPAAPAAAPAAPPAAGSGQSTSSELPTTERMIIRNASLSLVVADVDRTLADVAALTAEMSGFVVSSSSEERDGSRFGRAVVRVPSERLDEALRRIKGMAIRAPRETTNAQDVTEEYVDQDARLRSLKAQEDQYLELLKRASSVEDVLKVRQALGSVRQEIERTQARLQYLQRSSAMAAITIDLATSAAALPVQGRGFDPVEVAYRAAQALLDTLVVIASIAITVVVFAPIWVPAILLVRWWRRRRRAAKLQPVQPATPG